MNNSNGKNKKVCILTTAHWAFDARIFYRQARRLAEFGYEVCLITQHEKEEVAHGIKIIPLPMIKGRTRRMLYLPLKALILALRERAEIYHIHDPELIPTALVLKILTRTKVIYDVHEDYPTMMYYKSWIPVPLRKLTAKCMSLLERVTTSLLDGVVTADPAVLSRFDHIPSGRKMVFYNFPALDIFKMASVPLDEAKDYDLVYVGGISERTGIYVIIDVVSELVSKGYRLKVLLIGYFDADRQKRAILEIIKKKGLEKCFDFRGMVPHHDIPVLLSKAKIGLVPLQPIPKFLKNIPTKMFECWAVGLPVVASDLPPIRAFLKNGECGFLVDAQSRSQFCDAIETLLVNDNLRTQMGNRARELILNDYNSKSEGMKLVGLYQQL